jgi:RNA polymerase sigma-70 factor, ECF subfamily
LPSFPTRRTPGPYFGTLGPGPPAGTWFPGASARNDKIGLRMTSPGAGSLAQRRFREIVPPLLDDAYTLAKWLCRNGADAEDIVQEAAIRALKALETTAVERPKPWFLMIVRNAAMTWMGRNRPQGLPYVGDMADLDAIDPRLGEDAPDPEETLVALEDGEGLRRAIAALPASLREALVMRDVNGLSYRDIAEATDAPIGTVMSRLARARGALAKMLKAEP